MARWLPRILTRGRTLASARKVVFTLKARRELAALGSGLDEDDACDVLAQVTAADCAGRIESAVTGEWMFMFKVSLAQTLLYVKVILRSDCIVLSFHEDEGAGDEDQEA